MLVHEQPGFQFRPKIPSNSKVCAIAINDAAYVTKPNIGPDCLLYRTWKSMISRCYNPRVVAMQPAYLDVSVCPEWLYYSNFKEWAENFDWFGLVLDKDLLANDGSNKIYSPKTCCFIPVELNSFLVIHKNKKNLDLPVGVKLRPNNKFQAVIHFGGKEKHLGVFNTKHQAHMEWQKAKLEAGELLIKELHDPRIASAFNSFLDRFRSNILLDKELE